MTINTNLFYNIFNMSTFTKNKTIPDIIIIEPEIHWNENDFSIESYNKNEFESAGIPIEFIQDSQSNSKKWVFRWFHFQVNDVQSKLVRVINWSVLDFAIDLRKESPTYWKYVSEFLSWENKKQLYVPKWFAHGFLALEDNTDLLYKWDRFYNPKYERWLTYNDTNIWINREEIMSKYNIQELIISEKDKKNITLKEFENENPF